MSYLDPELAAFFTSCLDETERTAEELMFAARIPDKMPDFSSAGGPAAEAYWRQQDPAAILRSVKADRAVLAACLETLQSEDSHDYLTEGGTGEEYDLARFIVRQRASVYSTHPDYQERWKP